MYYHRIDDCWGSLFVKNSKQMLGLIIRSAVLLHCVRFGRNVYLRFFRRHMFIIFLEMSLVLFFAWPILTSELLNLILSTAESILLLGFFTRTHSGRKLFYKSARDLSLSYSLLLLRASIEIFIESWNSNHIAQFRLPFNFKFRLIIVLVLIVEFPLDQHSC